MQKHLNIPEIIIRIQAVAVIIKKDHSQIMQNGLRQRYQDSNLEMPESESGALPFGDSAIPEKIRKRGQEDSNPRPSGP